MIFDVFYSTNKNFGDQKFEIHFRHVLFSTKKSAPAMGDQNFEMIRDFRRVLLHK